MMGNFRKEKEKRSKEWEKKKGQEEENRGEQERRWSVVMVAEL